MSRMVANGAGAVGFPATCEFTEYRSSGVFREIAFIDGGVPESQVLIAGARPGIRTVVLDGRRDALAQIADALGRGEAYDAVHIVAHGAPREIAVSSGIISHANLDRHAGALARIGAALAPDAELLLWACAAGRGAAGRALLDALT